MSTHDKGMDCERADEVLVMEPREDSTMDEITNTDDVIDSRDVIERIEELESEQADALADDSIDEWERQGYGNELDALRELAGKGESLVDWDDGVALIRDDYFPTYAESYADDIGAFRIHGEHWTEPVDISGRWPFDCIDWEAAARDLQVDYTAVEFGGVTYWAR